MAGCSASTPQTKAEPDSGHALSEFLTFTGEIKGFLTAGLNARGNIHGQPSQGVFAQTSCATYRLGVDDDPQKTREWEADIYGKVGGIRLTLRIGLEGEPKPGVHAMRNQDLSPTDNATMEVDTDRELDLSSEAMSADTTNVTINPDMRSGKIHLFLTDSPGSDEVKERVVGTWRCA
ncbi:hypothetical protein ACFW08_26170 [Streptomyces sp. NPDC058960]|uniref:hypothetical protein n=1 Tax=Streptomyces sp. NPDC058960 TaxID=3346679 RepID=UPI0036AB78FE